MVAKPPENSNRPSRQPRSFSPWHGTAQPIGEISVLVVDADRVSRRFFELAMAPRAGQALSAVVECASDAAGAFDVLNTTLVDVIVAEVDLPDMSGLRFCRLLRQEARLQDIPLIFVSADTRVDTRVVALRAGADDYLVKPCDASELCARILVAATRRARLSARQRRRTYTLGGDFSTLSLADLVSILEMSRRTGALSIVTQRAVGEVLFDAGRIVHASFGNLSGRDAFFRMIVEDKGQFEFSAQALLASAARSIDDSVAGLLMEAARLLDHGEMPKSRATETGNHSILGVSRAQGISVRISECPVAPLTATNTLAARFEMAASDEFALGELSFFSHEDLSRWTVSEIGRERLHVHLIAELSAGVSSLLSMASPPGERWVREALAPTPKVLGLAFFLRHELMLDVTLIDIHQPLASVDCLRRRPALAILAPPEGDALALGPTSLVELDTLMRRLPPGVVLWAARTSPEGKFNLPALPTVSVMGALGESSAHLRTLLVQGIRFWAQTAKASAALPEKMA